VPVLRCALPDILPDAFDSLLPFRQHGREEVPDVDHVFPGFQGHVDANRFGPLRQARGVIEQRLGRDVSRWIKAVNSRLAMRVCSSVDALL
jgi:hypothetical protein